VLIGDAAYTPHQYAGPADEDLLPGQASDPVTWRNSLRRIQSMSPARVHFCHHTDVIHTLPQTLCARAGHGRERRPSFPDRAAGYGRCALGAMPIRTVSASRWAKPGGVVAGLPGGLNKTRGRT
jgi:hypothetical protein